MHLLARRSHVAIDRMHFHAKDKERASNLDLFPYTSFFLTSETSDQDNRLSDLCLPPRGVL